MKTVNKEVASTYSVSDAKIQLKEAIGKEISVFFKAYGKSVNTLTGKLTYVTDSFFGICIETGRGCYTQSFMFKDIFTGVVCYTFNQ